MTENTTPLTTALERLSVATDLESITGAVAEAARRLAGADGATFVLRDGEKCYYVDEDAIAPLWKGNRFPAEACISGWSMNRRETVVIPDITLDSRIPQDAYRPTFVKSLCMVPIRRACPLGAIGTYWSNGRVPTAKEIRFLEVLANSTAVALENLDLKKNWGHALHTMAHDLRSPLAAMSAYAELLQGHPHLQNLPGPLSYIESILESGRQASEQITRMLTIYAAGQRDLNPQPLDLTLLIRELFENFRVQNPSRPAEIDVEPKLMTFADPFLIRLVLENLLSNAFKYSSKKPATLIRAGMSETAADLTTFYVQDNGAGFEPEHATKLFQPLLRLHNKSEFPGTGLGLASAAKIVALHGGQIRAEGAKSSGATFFFSLPSLRPVAS